MLMNNASLLVISSEWRRERKEEEEEEQNEVEGERVEEDKRHYGGKVQLELPLYKGCIPPVTNASLRV